MDFEDKKDFCNRHIGPRKAHIQSLLKKVGCANLSDLIQKSAPEEILNCKTLKLPEEINEEQCLNQLRQYAKQNKILKNYIGMGYYESKTPPVIQRNILENPVWLTSYTPYQSEISQGRLTALLNFQTMIIELTEMDSANSSLLDEGTATAEAVALAFNHREEDSAKGVFLDTAIFPQTQAVLNTRAKPRDWKITTGSAKNFNFNSKEFFCAVVQYPDSTGAVYDWSAFCKKAKENNIITIFVADLLSLCLLTPPGAWGADITVGTTQRMGLPLFFGGPHAGYIAVKEKYTRSLPGRIVGVSKDRHGKPALRLALQTREQHIRRERANSNICTAQALLAVASSMYALYHGPEGLKKIATRIHLLTLTLNSALKKLLESKNAELQNKENIFDTVQVVLPKKIACNLYEKFLQDHVLVGLLPSLNYSKSEHTTNQQSENATNSQSEHTTNKQNENTTNKQSENTTNSQSENTQNEHTTNSQSENTTNSQNNTDQVRLSFSINETTTLKDIEQIVSIMAKEFNNTETETEEPVNKQPVSHSLFKKEFYNKKLKIKVETKTEAETETKTKTETKTTTEAKTKTETKENTNTETKTEKVLNIPLISRSSLSQNLIRSTPCLKHPVFQTYHSETRLIRYIHSLQKGDLSLTHSMIPLGSCTMKLNATTELMPMSWPGFAHIHPFAPPTHTQGYQRLITELEEYLCEITGFSAVSFQPNAGSQGEYAGLLMIKQYHKENNNTQKKICLIPSSAHGTNPASTVMAGLTPVTVQCDAKGNISHTDLKEKLLQHKNKVACFMLTFPSTFGVFEEDIPKVCEWVHQAGGLVYLDGANMNALVGLSQPAQWGADVCHLNLHKTFCIPHGGGGPGVGPVAVSEKLKKFLPTTKTPLSFFDSPNNNKSYDSQNKLFSISSAPWGSAGILMISWAYIRLMGAKGLKQATQVAVLNANYIARQLSPHYKVLYKGKNDRVAHECVLDMRKFRNTTEVTVDDIAKRLIDYGFHAPTMSWPIPGTLMIEPTESEDKAELDRFCDALIEIRKEIKEIEDKKFSLKNNVLKNAPHTIEDSLQEKWDFPYSKQKAFTPLPWVKEHKFWPTVSRVENAYGDINLFCSCPPL